MDNYDITSEEFKKEKEEIEKFYEDGKLISNNHGVPYHELRRILLESIMNGY